MKNLIAKLASLEGPAKTTLTEGSVQEAAKWRQGYNASGHPAGYKHKDGQVGPVGGTFTNEPSGYDGETSKVPVQKYRDQPDQLADRGQTKVSTTGKPLQAKSAQRNLKHAIQQSKGKHGPVGALPESEENNKPAFGKRDWDAESEDKPQDKFLSYKAKGGKLSRRQWEEDKANGADDVDESYGAQSSGSIDALNDQSRGLLAKYKAPRNGKESLASIRKKIEAEYGSERSKDPKTVATDDGKEMYEAQRHAKETGKKYSDQTGQFKGGKNYDELAAKKMASDLTKKATKKKEVTEMWGDNDHAPDKMSKSAEAKYVAKLKARNTKKKEEPKKKTAESKIPRKFAVIVEGVSFKVSSPHLAKVLRRFPHELAIFNTHGELEDDLYHALFDHYSDEGEMPYGVAKARDGDPYNWISDRLSKDLNGASMGHPADKANYMADESVVDEAPMNPFQQQRSAALSKSKDDVWAKARANVQAGGNANPFKTPAQQNPAFGAGGERAGQARNSAGVWSGGNFEGVGEGAAGDIMELEDEDTGDWYDAQGNSDPDGAYDAGGHYDSERDVGRLDYMRDAAMDEDSVAPEVDPGDELITEGMESVITDVLTNVGLDHGLDFFFEHGLVIIGKSTARVAINALQADERITSTPSIAQCDGEECRIEFNAGGGLDGELDEAMTDVQKWRMAQMQGDTYQTGGKQMDLDKEYNAFLRMGDKQSAAAVKQKMAQLAAQRMRGATQESAPPVEEGLADDFLAMTQGMKNKDGTPRFPGARIVTPDQKRQERAELDAKRAADAAARPPAKPAPFDPDAGFGQSRGYGQGRYMGDSKQRSGKALTEDVNLNITANGEEDVLNVIRKLSGLGATDLAAPEVNAAGPAIAIEPDHNVGSSEMSPIIAAMDAIIGGDDNAELSTPEDDAAEEIVVGGHDHEFEEGEYANEPDPTVHTSTTAMINQGNDLNRPKKQGYPMRNPGNNPMAEARSLMRQYETMLRGVAKK